MDFNKAQKKEMSEFAAVWSGVKIVGEDFENFLVQFNKIDPAPDPIEKLYYLMFKSNTDGFHEWSPNNYIRHTKQDAKKEMAVIALADFEHISYYVPGVLLTLEFSGYSQSFKIKECNLVDND